jgi:DNA repair protein RecN (Recombination protein N)
VVVDPIRLEIVSDTLSTIYSLQQKHLVNDVFGLMDKERELTSICNIVLDGDESIQIQKQRLDIVEKKVWQCAKKLSKCRHDYSKKLADELTFRLAQLGMEHARFNFQLAPEETLGSMGTDALTLLFSANKGIDFGLLRKVASGGERSRIMLVVKSILAKNHHLPSMILDEIDAGVSGEMAKAMGSLMKEISKHTQLIAITHLPQIAAAGNTHLKVYKSTDETTTRTHIKLLAGEERVEEIAQMLDGNQITQSGRSHAKQLLN